MSRMSSSFVPRVHTGNLVLDHIPGRRLVHDLLQNGGTRASAVRCSLALTARLAESCLLEDGDPGLLGDAGDELLSNGLEQSRLAGTIAPDKGVALASLDAELRAGEDLDAICFGL